MLQFAIKTRLMTLVYLQQVKSIRTKLIDFISDDDCSCSISWHYSVNAAEQHRKLLDSFKRWPKECCYSKHERASILQGCEGW